MLTDGQKKEAQDLFSKGYTTAQVFRHFGAQSIGQDSEIAIEESAIAKAETTPAYKPLSQKITGVLGLDSATQTFGDMIARTRLGAKLTGGNVEANREFIEAPTGKEMGGAILKTAVTAASPAIAPIGLVPSMVAGAGVGFGREVGQNLMDDKQGTEILQPGMETAIGAAVPPVFKGLGRVLGGPSVAATADDLIKMKAGDAARDAVEATMPDYKIDYSRLTNKLKERATGIATAPKSATEAVGEVLQGQTDDVAKGMKAFRQIDTKDVKTYADLDGKIKESITRLSKEVDTELAKDTTVTPLSELASTVTSKGGNKVSTNYVQTSLQQLDELYTTTGDLAAKADLDMLISKANTQGLTKLEVNDLSRIYNQEFGSKAFSKMGDPLTSVNAQMYENVRKGLKDKAREGIGGATAKALDSDISALYNTQKLVQKNVEKVNQLKQKIQDRGLLEKMGHGLTKGIDLVTGGTIRGLVGGLLPRGAGYKVMNALDLEERLAKNLLMIDDALKAGTDDALIKAMKEVQIPTIGTSIKNVADDPSFAKGATPPTTLDPKNFKTAEEYVKAQGTPLYHGTNVNFTEFKQSTSGEIGKGVYFYDDSSKALDHVGDRGRVVEAYFDGKLATMDDFRKTRDRLKDNSWTNSATIDDLEKQGFVGIIRPEGNSTVYNIFNPGNIKTRESLEEVWKKANQQ